MIILYVQTCYKKPHIDKISIQGKQECILIQYAKVVVVSLLSIPATEPGF